jgi:hypothetical protein
MFNGLTAPILDGKRDSGIGSQLFDFFDILNKKRLPLKLDGGRVKWPPSLGPVDTTAFVRFGTNSYSVPPRYARQTVTLVASDYKVRLLNGGDVMARHDR